MIENFFQIRIVLELAAFFTVLLIGAIITRGALMPLAARAAKRKGGDEKAVGSAENLSLLVGMMFALAAALQAGGFGNLVTVIGTIAAAATVAIGFGMRDQISNLMAGVFIHLDTPFVKGDFIESEGVMGTVKQVGLRATTIDDGREKKMIPNAQLTTKTTINHSKGRKTHMNIKDSFSPAIAEDVAQEISERLEKVDGVGNVDVKFLAVEEGKMTLKTAFSVQRGKMSEVRDRALRSYAKAVEAFVEESASE